MISTIHFIPILTLDSVFNKPNFLSDIQDGLKRAVSIMASKVVCNQVRRLYDALGCLHLPTTSYYFQSNSIVSLIILSIISDTNQIVMDRDADNAFYVFNEDGIYMRFIQYKVTNLYTYVVEEGSEFSILTYITVEGEKEKHFDIDRTCAKVVVELQEALVSPSDYDLAKVVVNNVVGQSPFHRIDIRIDMAIY